MKQYWAKEELETVWQVLPNEEPLIRNKRGATRLGYAVFLKWFQHEGRFPSNHAEVPLAIVAHIASQVDVETEIWSEYPWQGRSSERNRSSIRSFCGFREATLDDGEKLENWLVQKVLMWFKSTDVVSGGVLGAVRPHGMRINIVDEPCEDLL